MVALLPREISSCPTYPPPSLGSGSTRKTPHCGVLLAQDDTRGWRGVGVLCLLPSPSATPPPLPKGEQRENATVWRFLEAKSSPQGVEGEGYAPTRNDYVAGQRGYGAVAFTTHDSGVKGVAKTEQKRSRQGSHPRSRLAPLPKPATKDLAEIKLRETRRTEKRRRWRSNLR